MVPFPNILVPLFFFTQEVSTSFFYHLELTYFHMGNEHKRLCLRMIWGSIYFGPKLECKCVDIGSFAMLDF